MELFPVNSSSPPALPSWFHEKKLVVVTFINACSSFSFNQANIAKAWLENHPLLTINNQSYYLMISGENLEIVPVNHDGKVVWYLESGFCPIFPPPLDAKLEVPQQVYQLKERVLHWLAPLGLPSWTALTQGWTVEKTKHSLLQALFGLNGLSSVELFVDWKHLTTFVGASAFHVCIGFQWVFYPMNFFDSFEEIQRHGMSDRKYQDGDIGLFVRTLQPQCRFLILGLIPETGKNLIVSPGQNNPYHRRGYIAGFDEISANFMVDSAKFLPLIYCEFHKDKVSLLPGESANATS